MDLFLIKKGYKVAMAPLRMQRSASVRGAARKAHKTIEHNAPPQQVPPPLVGTCPAGGLGGEPARAGVLPVRRHRPPP